MEQAQRESRTRAALKEAFTRLSKTQAPDQISVAALCREANVSRSAFYSHYPSYEDFLSSVADQVIQDFLSIAGEYTFDTDISPMIRHMFDYILDNLTLISAVLAKDDGARFSVIQEKATQRAIGYWSEESKLPPEQQDLLLAYVTGGSIFLMQKWQKTGCSIDKATVIELLEGVMKYGVYNYIYTV